MPRRTASESEWLTTTEKHADTLQGRTEETLVVRNLPPKPTDRQCASGVSKKSIPQQKETWAALAKALAQPGQKEFQDERLKQLFHGLKTARTAWQKSESLLEEECVSHIHELGKNFKVRGQDHGGLVPTVILSSNSLASGDQDATYQRLQHHLTKNQNAYVASLDPSDFARGLGGVLSRVLSLLSDGAGSAEDIHALYQWYEEQTGSSQMDKLKALEQQQLQQQQAAAQQQQAQPGRKLRTRKKDAPPPKGQQRIGTMLAQHWQTNQQRQLVVLIRSAEQVPALILADVLAAFLQDYARFPVTLVLGCCQPSSLFVSGLPLTCRSRLAPHTYDLPTPHKRLEALISDVLCSGPPLLALPSELPLLAILQHYEHSSGSIPSVVHALELAHVLHHASQPLAVVTYAAMTETCSTEVLQKLKALTTLEEDKTTAGDAAKTTETVSLVDSDESGSDRSDDDPDDNSSGDSDDGKSVKSRGARSTKSHRSTKSNKSSKDKQTEEDSKSIEDVIAALPEDVVLEAAQVMQLHPAYVMPPEDGDGSKRHGVLPMQERCQNIQQVEEAEIVGIAAARKPARGKVSGRNTSATSNASTAVVQQKQPQAPQLAPLNVETARKIVLSNVQSAVDVLAKWRLGVLLCHEITKFTGLSKDRPELRLAAVYAAAASPAFDTPPPGPAKRPSSCDALLSMLCGSKPGGVASLNDHDLGRLVDDLLDVANASQMWRPLADVTHLVNDLQDCLSNAKPWLQQHKEHPTTAGLTGSLVQEARTPSKRPPAHVSGAGGHSPHAMDISPAPVRTQPQVISPTSVVRRGLAAAQLNTPQGKGASAASGHPSQPSQPEDKPHAAKRTTAPVGGNSRAARMRQLQETVQSAGSEAADKQRLETEAAAKAAQEAAQKQGAAVKKVPSTFQDHLAELLRETLKSFLSTCPFDLPGSVAFTFHDALALEDTCLAPAPRTAVHDALLHPSVYLGPHVMDDACPLSSDVEIAYQRLTARDSVAVTAWFDDFCHVLTMDPTDYMPQVKKESKPKVPKRKKGKDVEDQDDDDDDDDMEMHESTQDLSTKVLTWAARFSHAASELQHMGIIRPSKRRKDQTVTVMFQPPQLDLGF